MKCRNCGADIPDGKIYCEKCGKAIQMVPDYSPEEDFFSIDTPEHTKISQVDHRVLEHIRRFRWKYVAACACLISFGVLTYQIGYQHMVFPGSTEPGSELPLLLSRPEFSVLPGRYEYSVEVSISHELREEGTIYYTTDGTTPGVHSQIYNRPILLDEGTTVIRAVFIREDGMQSEEADGTYEVVFDYPDEPVFSVPGGDYAQSFYVTLTAESDCRIYYTTNGEEPGYHSRLYQGPIYIPAGLTVLQAVSVDEDGGMSGIMEAIYNVTESIPDQTEGAPPSPEINPAEP